MRPPERDFEKGVLSIGRKIRFGKADFAHQRWGLPQSVEKLYTENGWLGQSNLRAALFCLWHRPNPELLCRHCDEMKQSAIIHCILQPSAAEGVETHGSPGNKPPAGGDVGGFSCHKTLGKSISPRTRWMVASLPCTSSTDLMEVGNQ